MCTYLPPDDCPVIIISFKTGKNVLFANLDIRISKTSNELILAGPLEFWPSLYVGEVQNKSLELSWLLLKWGDIRTVLLDTFRDSNDEVRWLK